MGEELDKLGVQIEGVVECKCGSKFFIEQGEIDYKSKDDMGKLLSWQAAEHKAKFRVRCKDCEKIFCANCNEEPYHLGFTCEELKHHWEAVKCRFCGKEIEEVKGGVGDVFSNVCKNKDCI